MADVKVFVSYSWSVEKKTGVVGQIESLCPARGIEFVRDESAMQHGDVIKDFMDGLTSGDHIVTVFSKPYFESVWCMYELLQIYQKGDLQERTHPIMADDCDLQNLAYRIEVVKYWTAKHDEVRVLLDDVDPSLIGKEYEEANMIRDIGQKVNDLMSFAKGRLITPLADLQAKNYTLILDKISPILPPDQQPKNEEQPDQSSQLSPFKKEIIENIQQELKESDVSIFVNAIREELNKLRPLHVFSNDDLAVGETDKIAGALVWLMEQQNDDIPAITKVLNNAFRQCFDRKKGKYREEAQVFREPITEATQQLLGWLVLAAVNEDQLVELLPKADFSKGVYFELPVETQGGVELIVSRCSEHPADVGAGEPDVEASYQTCVHTQQFDWSETSSLDTLKLLVWKKVFPELKQELPLTPTQVNQLDAAIAIRRHDDWDREHHYLAIQGSDIAGNTHYKNVCDQLLTEMPSLTLVNFGVSGEQSVFYMPEHHLMQGINRFLSSVNKV